MSCSSPRKNFNLVQRGWVKKWVARIERNSGHYRVESNPARWKGLLDKILPAPGKIAKVDHHRALPYSELTMMPLENDELVERDFRYGMLLNQLQSSQISDDEALPLHMWLSDQVSQQLQQQAISSAIGMESLAEQIKICTMLLAGASVIEEQFTFLNQLSPLDIALSQAYQSNQQEVITHSDSSSTPPEEWTDFRERLARDSAVLVQAAKQALSNLKGTQIKKGRRTKEWRNRLFVELDDRLMQLQPLTWERRVPLATDIWNIYFPDDEINDPDSAGRIITREKKRRRTQGQNAAETG